MLRKIIKLSILFLFASTLCQCGKTETFPELGDRVAGPIDVATSDDGSLFYVLNSDFDRTYNTGSILVIDENGKKVSSVPTRRMGRALALAGTDLLVMYDRADPDSQYAVQLYDLTKPKEPKLVRTWESTDVLEEFSCLPINAVIRKNYKHFFVSCSGGELLVGTLTEDRSQSTLKLVRHYTTDRRPRRALYLDPDREMLLAFPTDYSFQKARDFEAKDVESYDPKTGNRTAKPNDIPDEYESSKYKRRSSWSARLGYQMLVYNIAAEREKGFPLVDLSTRETTEQGYKEQRYFYFSLQDGDGTYDSATGSSDATSKHYRTNFWSAQPDPTDPNAFYLSHRGKQSEESRYANNIVRVSFRGNLLTADPSTLTSDLIRVERAFGYNGEIDPKNHFPSDFRVLSINGKMSLIINHFKDYVNFRKDAYFGITAKLLSGSSWYSSVGSSAAAESYFQVAVNSRGKALSCAYYGNAVIPLEIDPGTELKLGWENIKKIE